jgi:dTDP-4-dehydrorhamnose reductase
MTHVLIVGASGMLGRALRRELEGDGRFRVTCTAMSRVGPGMCAFDLTADAKTVYAFVDALKPALVVNCAAERDPERASKDPVGTTRLNVAGAETLARACALAGASLVHLSTDYVFDGGVHTGVAAPYDVDARPHPLNLYAETKLASELAVLGVPDARALVVRVPVLYARDCVALTESASLTVATTLLPPRAPARVDDWGVRFPTLVDDVAVVLCALIARKTLATGDEARGILHVSSPHATTKYGLAVRMAQVLNVPSAHLEADARPPGGEPRPQNTQLDCARTWRLLGATHQFCTLDAGLKLALAPFQARFS